MSYIEIKTIKGNDYAYLRESIRIGKRVIHRNIRYLGRADALGKRVSDLEVMVRREPERIREVVKPIIREPITRIKKGRRIKFKIPKAIRQLPLPEREIAIEEIKKKKKIKKKIKKIKKIKKENPDTNDNLFKFFSI